MSEESPPGKAIGKTMLIISWIFVLIVLVLLFGRWEEKQYNPNMSIDGVVTNDARTVVLERNRFGHYVSSGKVNGVPVTFMLDTGATQVAIPANLADKLRLTPGARFNVVTANGIVEVRATTIDELHLGPIVLHDVRAAINPGMSGEEILLGMSVLKQLDFSQRNNELTLTQYTHGN